MTVSSESPLRRFPLVLDLLYWRDRKKSAVVLVITLIALYVLATYPLILVFSYLGLAVLGGTFCFRVYRLVEARIKNKDAPNPFQPYLDHKIEIQEDKVHQQADIIAEHLKHMAVELRRLILVENMCDSVKFGLLLWALTYVGSWFSGFCLLTMLVLGIFTVPKVYEVYQEPIDANLAIIKSKLEEVSKMIGEKVPFLKCGKAETHEKTT
ncbi:unnamed protein product [Enterobius vermicularis]|uniref:Reticulon-like protein n=1 Tax=Enterobius vermicularis TaxID=51028 RepID=A0A0N4VGW3_ENTVE|nr:unnamed protein product [Enterobius vermicularis]